MDESGKCIGNDKLISLSPCLPRGVGLERFIDRFLLRVPGYDIDKI